MTTWEKLMLRHAAIQTTLLGGLLASNLSTSFGEKGLEEAKKMADAVDALDTETTKALSEPTIGLAGPNA